ncbi:hypothetical protein B0H13DRAFT_1882927 [Mycena leptocephala]|nr:hypothetical protein B0H13DRAFT_1882927 [Mycena leptocephala]
MDSSDSDSNIIALDGATNYADNDVDAMILATAREHPEAARKFLVRTPALMAKQAKNQQQKQRAASKRKQDADDNDDKPKAKKAKGKTRQKDLDDDQPPPSITYYINIPKPPPLTKKRGAKTEDDDCLQKGPFSLPTSESYSSLVSAMAAELPCRKENINETKITWKPKKPKNGEKLPLGKDTGYKAMVTEIEGKAPEGRVMKVLTGQKDFFLIVVGDLNEILQDLSISVKIFQDFATFARSFKILQVLQRSDFSSLSHCMTSLKIFGDLID